MAGYLTLAAAQSLAAGMIGVDAFTAAATAEPVKALAALDLASDRVDAAVVYQGTRYDPRQERQFPRIPYAQAGTTLDNTWPPVTLHDATYVWDFDDATATVVVPLNVRRAVVYEAAAILTAGREARRDAIHDGLLSQGTGSLSESYRDPAASSPVCRDAHLLLSRYAVRQGRIL
jgi:hypothetical protein